ncbi:hypothetical protein EUGRSUZ_G03133 [Eucalyptus grandis]|uniref:Uncharacterized protein n=2 Tax=Eucalyptus grandis TaxID=71139 RepID=A0ACC3K8W5_EUCGR|nr:hypothetical protein EUGRSUZ_G03133 [Eucalyptus grandis]
MKHFSNVIKFCKKLQSQAFINMPLQNCVKYHHNAYDAHLNELIVSDTRFHTCSSHAVNYPYKTKRNSETLIPPLFPFHLTGSNCNKNVITNKT